MKRAIVLLALVAAASIAAAGEPEAFKERLTRDEILAAAKAARDRLPAVDKPAAEKCTAMPHDSAVEREAMLL